MSKSVSAVTGGCRWGGWVDGWMGTDAASEGECEQASGNELAVQQAVLVNAHWNSESPAACLPGLRAV